MWEICRREDKEFQREEVNLVPLSEVRDEAEGVWNTKMGNPGGNERFDTRGRGSEGWFY
jgi:hypothetical protein